MRRDEKRWDLIRWDEMRWDEMGWDKMRFDKIRWDEMRWHHHSRDHVTTINAPTKKAFQVGCDYHYQCSNCHRWVPGKSRWTKICHIYLIRFLLTWVEVGLGLTLAQWCKAPPLSIVPQTPMRLLLTWVGFGDDSGSIVLQPPMRFFFDLQTLINFRRLVYGLGLWQENSSKCFQQYNIREDGG